MAFKPKNKGNPNRKLSRKQIRKEKRQEKKVKRNEFYSKKGKKSIGTELQDLTKVIVKNVGNKKPQVKKEKSSKKAEVSNASSSKVLSTEEIYKKEKREQSKIKKDMSKQRKEQLLKANEKEDRIIKQLEKKLKLNKRKTKALPKSFVEDGLDYLLEVCDPEYMRNAAAAEHDLNAANDNFEEDFALMTGESTGSKVNEKFEDQSDDDSEHFLNENDASDENDGGELSEADDESFGDLTDFENEDLLPNKKGNNKLEKSIDTASSESSDEEEAKLGTKKGKKRQLEDAKNKGNNKKKRTDISDSEKDSEAEVEDAEFSDSDDENDVSENGKNLTNSDMWEDIYGRLRSKDGAVIENTKGKYIPPAIRARMEAASGSEDKKRKEKLDRLKKQLKGLLNRLAESNMHSIAGQIEDLYMKNSRNDMNETLTSLIMESLISPVLSPERLLIEHIVLISVLHANVGTEVAECCQKTWLSLKDKYTRERKKVKTTASGSGASETTKWTWYDEMSFLDAYIQERRRTVSSVIVPNDVSLLSPQSQGNEESQDTENTENVEQKSESAHFLQTVIKKFDSFSKTIQSVEDKSLDNVVNILAQLYNFKVFDAKLLYEILQKLAITFEEKNVECILHILRSVGFGLRKDDPLALKNLILELQKQAASASEGKITNSRVKFLLDVLLAIKNNNVTKIPNYDTSYSEHLKKIMKGFIRKGNYVTPLNISLEDLLKADERGKWWVVGSAWTGNIDNAPKTEKSSKSDKFSQKLLDLARKQRMNTDTRRDIFCIIMSAEDYLDAFEKLLRLGLKNQQEREIIHVLLHCCLQEKVFNPYYAVLAQKFCDYDRKFQMTIKCSVWDKLKALSGHSGGQLSNLAKLLTHLFIEQGLPISTLKIVEFSELDQTTLRLMRQILLGILLHNDLEDIQGVFEKVARSDKLKMFRESLRLFVHHFLLRNLKADVVSEDQKQLLQQRAKVVETILTTKESKFRL